MDNADKKGVELKAQRFQMLEDIAVELSGEVIFPTYFDAVVQLRKVLNDPGLSIGSIAQSVSVEPLISAKLLQIANSVAFNRDGKNVTDLKSAISRLGLSAVRSASMSIVMTQLLRAKGLVEFANTTRGLWEHSIQTAAAAKVIAATMTRLNPDEAMLAGMIHDLGAFYMLYRATQYDELRNRPETVKYLIIQWHESIGVTLLNALGMPEEIVTSTIDHDRVRPAPDSIRTLSDVVYIANMLSGGHFEWLMQDQPDLPDEMAQLNQKFAHLRPQISELTAEIQRCMG